jgi:hypothetical protein
MCIRVIGTDETSNKWPTPKAKKYFGTIVKGKVMDACSECEDDHIDIMADRPYTNALVNSWNPKARYYNSLPGARAIPVDIVYSVGVWKAQWNFVDCKVDCKKFFE